MKREILSLLVLVFFINLVSASYGCSAGAMTSENRVVDVGKIEPVNGIDISLIDSSGSFSAEFLADADTSTIFNSSSVEVNLLSGDYDVKLLNLTDSLAIIDVDGDDDEVGEGETVKIKGLQVHVLDFQGTYPGTGAEVNFIIGSEYVFLYAANPSSIKTIDGEEYLFELLSSVNGKARIDVSKCQNGSIIEVEEPEETGNVSNATESENSSSQEESSTGTDNETDTETNTTSMDESQTSEDLGSENENAENSSLLNTLISPYMLIPFALSVILIVLLFIQYKKSKGEVPSKQSIRQEPETQEQ